MQAWDLRDNRRGKAIWRAEVADDYVGGLALDPVHSRSVVELVSIRSCPVSFGIILLQQRDRLPPPTTDSLLYTPPHPPTGLWSWRPPTALSRCSMCAWEAPGWRGPRSQAWQARSGEGRPAEGRAICATFP